MDQEGLSIPIDRIKNLILDFGGVIINLTRNRCIESFANLGVDVHEMLINNYQHKDMFMQLELGNISPEVFYDLIRKIASQNLTNEQINEAWIAMLADVPDSKFELLLELRKRYNVFLLSNTNIIHWDWAEENIFSYKGFQSKDFFDGIYLSFDLHMIKPDAEIFNHVLQDANILPEETLFIDDALVNCKAAEELGIWTYMPEPREDWSFLFK